MYVRTKPTRTRTRTELTCEDKDKDLSFVLKESLRTMTRIDITDPKSLLTSLFE